MLGILYLPHETPRCPPAAPLGKSPALALQADDQAGRCRDHGYLTDFRLDAASEERLVAMLDGCTTIVCENNFRNAEQESAVRTFHMVSADVGRLAARVKPDKLILFHLSDRYTQAEWQEQLDEVRTLLVETYFPESWNIGLRLGR